MTPEFGKAMAFVIPWGVYKDQTIDQAAADDRGLRWLRWMLAKLEQEGDLRYAPDMREFRDALRIYLAEPSIADALAKITHKKPETTHRN